MLSAFTARPLVELRQRDKSKIESLLAYGDRLLAGLNTGSLRIYRVNETSEETDTGGAQNAEESAGSPASATTKPTDLLREEEKFARYKIEQLAIIKEANVLVSLSGGYVSLHDWQTRKSLRISSDPGAYEDPAVKNTGRHCDVRYELYRDWQARPPKPLATRLSEGQMLLAKDVNTPFYRYRWHFPGPEADPPGVRPQRAVGYSYPYILALQEPSKGTLEVRNPETLSLLQSISLPSASIMHIPQPNISLAHAGKGFLVASERVIWRMNALDYDSQIDSLVEQGHLDEAISLLEMLEDALTTNKAGRLRQVKLQKAQSLFDSRKYRASLDLFTAASAPPELVIRLYPKLIAGDLSTVVEDESQSEPEESGSSTPQPVNGTKTNGVEATTEDKIKGKGVGYTPSVRSFLRYRTDDGTSETNSVRDAMTEKDSGGTDKPLQGKDLKGAVYELQGFLADIRRRLQRFLNPDGSAKVSNLFDNGESDEFTKSVISILDLSDDKDVDVGSRLRETASLVDTTLFRAHMYATPSLAGSLFRIANFCEPDVVMEKLEETGRYNELIDFLFGKKLHRPALERLRKFGQADKEEESAPQLLGPRRTITYLQNLPPEMIDLILEFAEWPLRADPELGMDIFLADTENAETLPREKVLDFLQGIDSKLAIKYLEHVIGELNDMTPDLHHRLLLLYLERLKKWKEDQEEGKEATEFGSENEWEDCKEKFLDMLKASAQYSPAKMLDRLPREEIYVFKLNDSQKAEDYCNQIYLAEDPDAIVPDKIHKISPTDHDERHPSIYHTLLSLYLSPPHGYEPQYGPAIEILVKHGSRLPASSTLDLIPEAFPVHELEFYFRGRIRAENSVVNEGRIVAALRKVQNINTEADLLLGDGLVGGNRGRNRFVTVTEERMCGVCHKRLGGSVISVFPE
ncbi:hypothetical protein UREG_06272 [Uncinocarpus reesii 1704]|uniref:CNH domain-containing protein n=1 Tax=Uncinocarpus reesii (strain UAMH 1704) TaxID=336963 RepID=C4JX99_UNCRE|nr:uncharacterized protein UREG_06272 [Uncinocarpus reesii 1704]EEP81407.1 hypothetical protein UREG_06272 [Uncinocarpus reesii 1704]